MLLMLWLGPVQEKLKMKLPQPEMEKIDQSYATARIARLS